MGGRKVRGRAGFQLFAEDSKFMTMHSCSFLLLNTKQLVQTALSEMAAFRLHLGLAALLPPTSIFLIMCQVLRLVFSTTLSSVCL